MKILPLLILSWSQQQSAPITRFDDEALLFTPIYQEGESFESMSQSITVDIILDVELLPEPDDEGVAMANPQVGLLH